MPINWWIWSHYLAHLFNCPKEYLHSSAIVASLDEIQRNLEGSSAKKKLLIWNIRISREFGQPNKTEFESTASLHIWIANYSCFSLLEAGRLALLFLRFCSLLTSTFRWHLSVLMKPTLSFVPEGTCYFCASQSGPIHACSCSFPSWSALDSLHLAITSPSGGWVPLTTPSFSHSQLSVLLLLGPEVANAKLALYFWMLLVTVIAHPRSCNHT